ncbi:MAG: metal-dependent hydrolase [Promethearchaeota archaeon]
MSHLGLAYLLSLGFEVTNHERRHENRILLMIGSVMIDFSRPIYLLARYILAFDTVHLIGRFFYIPSHSILGVLLLAGFFAPLFSNYSFRHAYSLLTLGGFFHLLLDMTMWPWTGGLFLFFPLQSSAYQYSFRLIWPGDYHVALFFGLPLSGLALFHLLKDLNKQTNIDQMAIS